MKDKKVPFVPQKKTNMHANTQQKADTIYTVCLLGRGLQFTMW